MINSIIDGISVSLNSEFGDKYKVFVNELRQGLKEPCFFVSCIKPSNRIFLGTRYYRTHAFCVQYFPESKTGEREECNDVSDRLMLCLEYITVTGDLIRGTEMHSEIVDGILNFFVNYDFFVNVKTADLPIMEELEHGTDVKG